ncbi:MAG: hypothetical protein J6T48_02090, partial [Bacteroidales bacterium]|nr:hypothetical protein [Bacteroidales bacterium]
KEPRHGTVVRNVRKIRRDVARNICTIVRGYVVSLRCKMLHLYRRDAMNCACTICLIRKIRRDVARNICTIVRGYVVSLRCKMLRLYRRDAMNCACTIDMD